MIVAIGCDHAGFALRDRVIDEVKRAGHAVVDCGTFDTEPCDYPDIARKVSEAILSGKARRGVILCGSGVGASVAANKVPDIRAGLCHDTFSARQGVEDDNMNVLCLGARVIGPEVAGEAIRAFLRAEFSSAERHQRRVDKVKAIERDARAGVFERRGV